MTQADPVNIEISLINLNSTLASSKTLRALPLLKAMASGSCPALLFEKKTILAAFIYSQPSRKERCALLTQWASKGQECLWGCGQAGEKCLAALHGPQVLPTPQGTGPRTGTQDTARVHRKHSLQRLFLQLQRDPNAGCWQGPAAAPICNGQPTRESLLGHWASAETQRIEGDSSFQPIGHQGWPHVCMPIPSLPN